MIETLKWGFAALCWIYGVILLTGVVMAFVQDVREHRRMKKERRKRQFHRG